MIISYSIFYILANFCYASDSLSSISTSSVLPTFVSLNSNINDFYKFADGGDDANWYIGFNNAWIMNPHLLLLASLRTLLLAPR